MATVISNAITPSANTTATLLTTPGGSKTTCTVNVCNRGATEATVRIALSATTTPTDAEHIEYDVSVPPNGVLERGGIVRPASSYITVRASTANVSFNVWGFQE